MNEGESFFWVNDGEITKMVKTMIEVLKNLVETEQSLIRAIELTENNGIGECAE